MRIAIQDSWFEKFSGVLHKHWQSLGHTVLFEPGFNPNLIETCDRVFFESADTNSHLASQQRPYKKGKVFVRIVDVDMHCNGPASIKPGYFDGIIYIANHIKEMSEKRFANLEGIPAKVIRMGVDLNKYKFREGNNNKKIAFISTRLTPEKQFDTALWIFKELLKQSKEWELHVVGRMFENSVWEMHINHILDGGMRDNVKLYGNIPYTENAINDFLEDKSYLLSTSHKEAFSMVTGEAMSKGIRPIIYNFYGAKDIWRKEDLFNTPQEAVALFNNGEYTPKAYREFIEQNYSLERHLAEMDEFILN